MSIESNDNRIAGGTFLCLLVFASILFLTGLGRRHLWDSDEPRVAGITAGMAGSGDWVVPKLNGRPFLEKPPLYYWIAAPIFNILGGSTYSVRIPSALAAIGGVLLIFILARKMGFSNLSAFVSGLVLATSVQYWGLGRHCLIDMTLCLFTTGAMVCFFIAVRSQRRQLLWAAGFAISLACAILTKGLVGLAIPLSALAIWLVVTRNFSLRSWLILSAGSILSFIPAGIWFWRLCGQLSFETAYQAILANNFGRFSGGYAQHAEPFYYYFLKSPPDFLPWLFFVPIAFVFHVREIRRRGKDSPSLFAIMWFFIPSLLLLLSAGKRTLYMLPLFPAAALFIGQAVGAAIESKETPTKWFKLSAGAFVWTIIIASLGLLVAYIYLKQPLALWPFLSVPGICFGLWAERRLSKKDFKGFLTALTPALLAVFLTFDTAIAPINNKQESFEPLFSYCESLISDGFEICLMGPKERMSGAAVFYLGRSVPQFANDEKVMKFLNSDGKKAAIINEPITGNISDIEILRRFTIGNDTTIVAQRKTTDGEQVHEDRP